MINDRLALCGYFTARNWLRQDIQHLLRPLPDVSRLLQRLYMRRGDAFDLLGVAKFIKTSEAIRERVLEEMDREMFDSASRLVDERAVRRLLEISAGDDGNLQSNAVQNGFTQLAQKIDSTINEEALQKRTTMAEKKAGIAELLGVTQADRAISDEEEYARVEGIWGKDQDWVVRPESANFLHLSNQQLDSDVNS